MGEASDIIIGIDLGTTNSVVSAFIDGEAKILENELGDQLTPSVVILEPKSEAIVVGRRAKELVLQHPEAGAFSFKRDMGSDREHSLGEQKLTAIELSALVLKALKASAESALGSEVHRAVITVPAYFAEPQRRATLRAAELAGLKVERLLNEPTAAAMAYGLHRRDREGCFLVFDLGGGTFDVSVMELFEGVLEVKSTAGESRLGGDDFTTALIHAVFEKLDLDFELVEWKDPKGFARMLRRCDLAKRRLGEKDGVVIRCPAFEGFTAEEQDVELEAADVDRVFKPLLDRLRGPCRQALRGASLEKADLDEVILVGGATRMARVRALVGELFTTDALDDVDPDLTIAQGAAIQGALHCDDAAVEDVVVTDVLSHSLGVEVSHEIAGRYVDGFFSPIIHRNTTIPTSRLDAYWPIQEDQTILELRVFEGEARKTDGNRQLGVLNVPGIPRGPQADRAVEVRFTYDLNGILEVEATVVATGKTVAKVFEPHAKEMSESERKKALEKLAQLKSDPKEDAVNAELLARAESLLIEVGPEARAQLERMLLIFEQAMETRTPDAIRQARRDLRVLCERIDGGERW